MSEQLQLEDEEVSITLRRAWDRALRLLATRVNKPTFETHIRAIRPLTVVEPANQPDAPLDVTLGVPSAFTREWVEKRHSAVIAGVLEEIYDRDVLVHFTLTPRDAGSGDAGPNAALVGSVAPSPSFQAAPAQAASANAPMDEMAGWIDVGMHVGMDAMEGAEAADAGDADPLLPAVSPAFTAPPRPRTIVRSSGTSSRGEAAADASDLNPRYTFDTFVVGASNRLAQAGAQAVAQEPGTVYNPLFLYGPSGLGKTHLMHAIGNEVTRLRRDEGRGAGRVAYLSGEAFTSGYVNSLREHKAEEFRRKWRSVDVWLVDDIQFIAGKEGTKEEFFHTFNALYQGGKQIVISSDRSPRELPTMDERLRSRFECGLIADIAPPNLETRLAILQRKSEAERMRIPDEVLLYMARLVQTNVRSLEGALVKLIASASLTNAPITTELAASILERYYFTGTDASAATSFVVAAGLGASSAITPELVQKIVARKFGVPAEALSGKKRDKSVVFARQIAMHLTRELTQMSLPKIGSRFGGRDHTTVSYSCEKVKTQLPIDADLRRIVDDLTVQVRAAQTPD